jgi:uncharacterized RDD family membrane protein YckC
VRTVEDVTIEDSLPAPHISRVAAYLTDVALFGVPGAIGMWFAAGAELRTTFARLVVLKAVPSDVLGLGLPDQLPWRLVTTLITLTTILGVWTLYRVVCAAVWQRSVGKLLFGLLVVDASDRRSAIGWGRAWKRWLPAQALGLVPLPAVGLLGYCLAFVRPDHRGVHDLSAGSVVVRAASRSRDASMRRPVSR